MKVEQLFKMIDQKLLAVLQKKDCNTFRYRHTEQHIVKFIKVLEVEGLVKDLDVGVHKFEGKDLVDIGGLIRILVLMVLRIN
jgi:hypothetical protein